MRPRRDRDEGPGRGGGGACREADRRAGDRRAADPERARQRRPGRIRARRGEGRDRRRRRLRRVRRRARARAPQRVGARAAGRASRPCDAADPPDREGVGGRGLPSPGLRRRRPARLGEADLQRLLQRHVHDPRVARFARYSTIRPPGMSRRAAPERRTRSPARAGSRSSFDDPVAYARAFGEKIPTPGRRCCSTSSRGAAARST